MGDAAPTAVSVCRGGQTPRPASERSRGSWQPLGQEPCNSACCPPPYESGKAVEAMDSRSMRLALIACLVLLASLAWVQSSGASVRPHLVDSQAVAVTAKAADALAHCAEIATHSSARHQHDDHGGANHATACSAPASAGLPAAPPGVPFTSAYGRSIPESVTSLRELGIAPPRRPPRLFS